MAWYDDCMIMTDDGVYRRAFISKLSYLDNLGWLDTEPDPMYHPAQKKSMYTVQPPHGIRQTKMYKGYRYALGHKK